ncbi:MAG: hypothetical protein GKR88_02380 [Flavobacteriaceae bacterium]|nr:MAG: hypothetical protein GKR88_02380 [Flavobacteriaceae bacterium]
MIKLPKYIIQALFFLCLLIALIYVYFIYSHNKELNFFKYSNSFFLSILIGSLFLSLYQKESVKKGQLNIMKFPFLTAIIMIIEILVFSIFIRKLIISEIQNKEVLYWQISAPILAILSLIVFIKIHIKNIKTRRKGESNVA